MEQTRKTAENEIGEWAVEVIKMPSTDAPTKPPITTTKPPITTTKPPQTNTDEKRRKLLSQLHDFFVSAYGPRLLKTVLKLALELKRFPTIAECQHILAGSNYHRDTLRRWCACHEKELSPFLAIHKRKGRNGHILVPTLKGLKLALWLLELPDEYQHHIDQYSDSPIFRLKPLRDFEDELLQLLLR